MLLLGALTTTLISHNLMAQEINPKRDFNEVERFDAYYATQGVAVDKHHFYAIENNHITKFTLKGDSITTWHEPDKEKIRHINSGFVLISRPKTWQSWVNSYCNEVSGMANDCCLRVGLKRLPQRILHRAQLA